MEEKNILEIQASQSDLSVVQKNASERFTDAVMKQFGGDIGAPNFTEYQKRLIQGYFIGIDRALKTAEDERIRKNSNNKDHKWDNNLPVIWSNVNLRDLAIDVVHCARIGLDMTQDNHLFAVPYKNKKTQKYDISLTKGYIGKQYVHEKYAVEKPLSVTIELVYSSDTFRPIKKDAGNAVETYEFTINQPFDRGDIIGGFGYIEYDDASKNELVIMSLKDIEKRKPKNASPNFWGGKHGDADIDGWFSEMCRKTIYREVYSAKHIPIDPEKVDESYQHMKLREVQFAEMEVQQEVENYANGEFIDTTEPIAELPDVESENKSEEISEIDKHSEGDVNNTSNDTAEPQMTIDSPIF